MGTDKLIAVIAGLLSAANPSVCALIALVLIVFIATLPGILRGIADIIRAKKGASPLIDAPKTMRRLASRRAPSMPSSKGEEQTAA